MDIDQTRFDDGVAVAVIDLKDFFHSRQRDHHAAADWKTSSGQTGSRTTRNKRNVKFIAEFNDCNDLFGRRRKDNHIGRLLIDDKSVAFVDQQFVMVK